jgi:hypothetical protein
MYMRNLHRTLAALPRRWYRFSAAGASENGSALVVALLVLLVLSTMALAFVSVTKTEKQISGNELRESQAMYGAEAGISEAIARMSRSSSPAYIGEDLSAPSPGWGRYLVMSNGGSAGDPEYTLTETDSVDNDGDGHIDESGEAYPEVASSQLGLSTPIGYPWVKVTYKYVDIGGAAKVVLFGDHDNNPVTKPTENVAQGYPVLIVTGNGIRGNADKTIEVEAVKLPGPPVPGAVYMEGTMDCKGTQFHIDGNDYDPTLGTVVAGATPLPGVVATGGPSSVSFDNPFGPDNVEGSTSSPSIVTPPFDLDLQAYFNTYASMADIVYHGDTDNPVTSGWGGLDDYKIVCVQGGDLHLSGNNGGGGVLLVDGDFVLTGQFTWYGLIIVLGDVDASGGGAGIHVYGCVMSQGSISGIGMISGNADLLYSSETIQKLSDVSTYTVSLWAEK